MGWLFLGVVYSSAYGVAGWMLRDQPEVLGWFRAIALLVPPLTGTVVIVRRRQTWSGCQWLFWSTIALGLAMSALGLTGWAAEELMLGQGTWLAWPAVFALFGSVAPLFALLAQPHQGAREPLAATTAVDIAGLAVVTGFLYSFFVTAPTSTSLLIVSELQQGLVVCGMAAAMFAAWRTEWRDTYRRLTLGAIVSFVTLTISNAGAGQGPTAPRSSRLHLDPAVRLLPVGRDAGAGVEETDSADNDEEELSRPRPWVIFTAVALLPFLDYGLRRIAPDEAITGFRDLSTAITIISVLPLLLARIAAERAELQQAGATMRLLAQVIEQAKDLILVMTADGRCRHANDAFCRAMNCTREELMTRRPRELMANDTISAEDIQAAVRSGGTWRGTVTRTRADGSSFPVSATVVALRDSHGKPTHFVSVERDISEERRLREQLIHSERLSAVGQLVAGVAHELNNPLQGVMGNLELMIGAEDRPQTRRDLKEVQVAGERAAKIVRNLLTFARKSALDRSVEDLNEIVRATLAWRATDLRANEIVLDEQYAAELPLIIVNREEIQQVILNLILNAELASRALAKPGTLHVRTGASEAPCSSDRRRSRVPRGGGPDLEPFFTTKVRRRRAGVGELPGVAEAAAR
jgi:PAS domain S-box-containing protein